MKTTLGIIFSSNYCYTVSTSYHKGKYTYQDSSKTACQYNKHLALESISHQINQHKQVVLGISHQDVQTELITIDGSLSHREIDQYARSKTTSTFFDYEIVSQTPKQISLRVISAPKSIIDDNQHVFNRAKVPLHVIDTDTLALHRLRKHIDNPDNRDQLSIPTERSQNTDIYFCIALGLSLWGAV